MAKESTEWILHGLDWDDPHRLRTWEDLLAYIHKIGFLPLFRNSIPGFSVEEHVSDRFWWTGDPEQDPWEWRTILARTGEVAYGKFFDKKAGFVSKAWFPHFANLRRDGYDFDARWDDGLASHRSKKIMDCFSEQELLSSHVLKQFAGFGKGGEKNYDGIVTELQMQSYLIIRDFRRRLNRYGLEYGMAVSVLSTPETLWGSDYVCSAYSFSPLQSKAQIQTHLQRFFPYFSSSSTHFL